MGSSLALREDLGEQLGGGALVAVALLVGAPVHRRDANQLLQQRHGALPSTFQSIGSMACQVTLKSAPCSTPPRRSTRRRSQEIRDAGLFKEERIITTPQGAADQVRPARRRARARGALNFCANNYLGLSSHPEVIAAAKRAIDDARLRPVERALHLRHAGHPQGARAHDREVLRDGRHHPLHVVLRRERRPLRDAPRRGGRHHLATR